jgi:serine/threonine protein kinase/tetratricopeptide (TPR) repeat protein
MNPMFHELSQTIVGRASGNRTRGQHSTLLAQCITDLQKSWPLGEALPVEKLLEKHPELADCQDAVVRLIVEEVDQRRRRGEHVSVGELYNRFPKLYVPLMDVLGATPQLNLPDHGPPPMETFGQFHLLHELGHGGGGRVYLASQSDLANRLVVLKFIPNEISEHLSLARLQHTSIVPLFGVYDDPDDNRRALCMPFFGSTTLGHVMDGLEKTKPDRRTGADFLRVLEEREHELPHGAAGSEGPGRHYLRDASYVQAVCWIGACLADALNYAHQRGLLHLDIKPSNVLLATDGQPMLLDFHLASPPLNVGDEPPEYFGGTPVYMSPEQRTACEDVTFARPITQAVDARADLYSLGMLLFVQLAGGEPAQHERTPGDLRRFNPEVSIGLSDILARCTADDPTQRYQTAAELAADLRHHLEDKPLTGVPNRSLAERWVKWRRREPYALTRLLLVIGLFVAVAGAGTLVFGSFARQQELTQSYFDAGVSQMNKQEFAQAAVSFREGIEAARAFGVRDDLREALENRFAFAEHAARGKDLHDKVEQLRNMSLADSLDTLHLLTMEAICKEMWKLREPLLAKQPESVDPSFDQRVRRDLVELAICWGEAHVRWGKPEQVADRRKFARDILAACADFTPSAAVLEWYRGLYADVGPVVPDLDGALRRGLSAWEGYCLGRLFLKSGEYAKATGALEESRHEGPADYWTNYCLGLSELRRERYPQAEEAFSVCVGKRSAEPIGYQRRGETRAARATPEAWRAALADYDYALALRPNVTDLLIERGKTRFAFAASSTQPAKMLELARDDLRQALEQGAAVDRAQPILAQVEQALKKQTAPVPQSGGGP